jgi:hypothetical protein
MYKRELVWAAIVACLSTLADRSNAIEATDGVAVQALDVPLHYLVAADVGIAGSGLTVVDAGQTPSLTAVALLHGSQEFDFYNSGTFTDGLAGGFVELVGHGQVPPVEGVQTVGGIGIDKGVCLSTGRMQNRNPSQAGGYGVEGPNEGQPEDLRFGELEHPGTASKYFFTDENQDVEDDLGDADLAFAAGTAHDFTNDRCALEFKVTTTVAGYIQVHVVFASDE